MKVKIFQQAVRTTQYLGEYRPVRSELERLINRWLAGRRRRGRPVTVGELKLTSDVVPVDDYCTLHITIACLLYDDGQDTGGKG